MLVKSDPSNLPPAIYKVARLFKLLGWLSFSIELGLAFISVLVLLFAASGRQFSPDSGTGIGIGIFWSICGVLVLCPLIAFSFRYTRIAKGLLRDPNVHWHPRKADVIKLLQLGTILGFIGMFLSLLGAGTSIGVLVAKTVSQPPGMAITDPNKLVRALDVYVVLANFNLITAHFVGIITSVWLLDRLHTHHH